MKRGISLFLILFTFNALAEINIYGWLEYVYVGKGSYRLKAKLDSGAKTSSIHVTDTEVIKTEDGTQKVKFKIKGSQSTGDNRVWKTVTMTKPVHRTVRVKSSNGEVATRVSVILPIRVGETDLETEFTLSDRADMNYPVLLGRSTIKDLGVIDCSETFLMQN